jgi:hypothetical protein
MENQIVPNNDIQFLASRSNQNLNVIIAGMTDLMEENDAKVAMLENQDWFQRMSYTITGQNKMTQREIQQNHDKINLYVTQALGELYNQNCINHEIILGLGNRINELYASQVEIKQIIGAFAQKLNEKIESIDSYHMLVTEVNQGVYRNKNKFVSLCQIMSQLDLRTVKDDRKMNILIRAMEEQEILKENRVTILNVLKELLEVSDNEAGMLMIFLGNIRSDMLANVMEQTLYTYYTVPEMIRPNINKNSIVENILVENSIDSSNAFSTYDLCVTLIDAYVNNIFEVAIEQQRNEEEEKKNYISEYLNNAFEFLSIITSMSKTWDANFGELNNEGDRIEYADFLINVIENIDFNSYIGNSIIENLNSITCFIQAVFAKIGDLRIKEVKAGGETSAKVNRNAAIWLESDGAYMTISEYYKKHVTNTFFQYDTGNTKDAYSLDKMLDENGFPNYSTFQSFGTSFSYMKFYKSMWVDIHSMILDKINNNEFVDEIHNICEIYPLEIDDEYEEIFIKKVDESKPHIEFIYKSVFGNKIEKKISYMNIGLELMFKEYDKIKVGINVRNLHCDGGITITRQITENSYFDFGSMSTYKYVDVEWGDSDKYDFQLIISKNNNERFGNLKMKVYIKDYPDIVGYMS